MGDYSMCCIRLLVAFACIEKRQHRDVPREDNAIHTHLWPEALARHRIRRPVRNWVAGRVIQMLNE